MKQRHLVLGTLLTITLLWNTLPAFAGQTAGRLDGVKEDMIFGWAYDEKSPEEPATVRVVVTSQTTGEKVKEMTTAATLHRVDLTGHGNGSGNYGFSVPINWEEVAEGSYLVEAFADDEKLPNSLIYAKNAPEDSQGQSADSAEASAGLRSLGVFKTTAYCPCRGCSEGWGRHTASGAIASANHTIAVDPRVIPYGSKVMINGTVYTAEDCGGAVKGNHIDIFFDTHAQTRQYGTRNIEVFLVQ